jgi:hypothetical protein
MLDAGISSTERIGRFWGIVPYRAEGHHPAASAGSDAAAEQRPARAQAQSWSGQSQIGKTIEDALRSAGLMK